MDFGALPPEINSALIYTGAGAGPLLEAGQAWSILSTELSYAAQEYGFVITNLAASWMGTSSSAMMAAATGYRLWLISTALAAQHTAAQANAAAGAYSAAFAATVPPTVIAANRTQLLSLIATNLFGQNAAAIAATEAAYTEMWAQDATAMNAYATSSGAAASSLPQFTAAPQTTNPAATLAQSAVTPSTPAPPNIIQQILAALDALLGGSSGYLSNTSALGQYVQAFISSGSVTQLPANIADTFFTQILALVALGTADTALAGEQALSAAASASATPFAAAAPTAAVSVVAAGAGAGNSIGQLSVPPSWAQPGDHSPKVVQPNATSVGARFQAAIPAVPFMPVTGLRSNQAKVRADPEYGTVSKVLPPRNPAGG